MYYILYNSTFLKVKWIGYSLTLFYYNIIIYLKNFFKEFNNQIVKLFYSKNIFISVNIFLRKLNRISPASSVGRA